MESETLSVVEQHEEARREKKRARLAWWVCRLADGIYRSLRIEADSLEGKVIPGKGAILVTWHGRTMIPAGLFRNRGYWALVSLSRDGELQSRVFTYFGFSIVRGSTGRGGVKGALQMARKVKEGGVLAFTPDGPRGPTHKVQPGVLLMAQKSGAPIITVGVSARWKYHVRSWDSYMIPLPFSRVRVVFGTPLYVPEEADDDARTLIAEELEYLLNRTEEAAEMSMGHKEYPWPTKK